MHNQDEEGIQLIDLGNNFGFVFLAELIIHSLDLREDNGPQYDLNQNSLTCLSNFFIKIFRF